METGGEIFANKSKTNDRPPMIVIPFLDVTRARGKSEGGRTMERNLETYAWIIS